MSTRTGHRPNLKELTSRQQPDAHYVFPSSLVGRAVRWKVWDSYLLGDPLVRHGRVVGQDGEVLWIRSDHVRLGYVERRLSEVEVLGYKEEEK